VLLLLHEDFPHELYAAAAAASTLQPAPPETPGPSVKHVVCVLGAVRDVCPQEEGQVAACAAAHGVRVACANLGRTAEFTSKVLLGLSHLHAHGRLAPAAAALAPAPAAAYHRLGGDHALARRPPQEVAPLDLGKLAPVRGWTWNGRKTSPVIAEAVAAATAPGAATAGAWESPPRRFRLHAVVNLPFASDLLRRAAAAGAGAAGSSGANAGPSNYESGVRDAVHAAVQAAVWVLWRSKVAGEAAGKGATAAGGSSGRGGSSSGGSSSIGGGGDGGDGDDDDDDDDDDGCVPVLSLAFSDGALLTASRGSLVRRLAERHHAAPSELQVHESALSAHECALLRAHPTWTRFLRLNPPQSTN
jgi:uncharacterized membrane protein YgcG